MSDNEIIKAFECCSNADRITECGRCPYYRKGCLDKVHADATDLINRQKAEIERLKKDTYLLHEDGTLELIPRTDIEAIKSEAVKEFAEMVKETAVTNITIGGSTYYCVGLHHLDNLVKEFTEGEKK